VRRYFFSSIPLSSDHPSAEKIKAGHRLGEQTGHRLEPPTALTRASVAKRYGNYPLFRSDAMSRGAAARMLGVGRSTVARSLLARKGSGNGAPLSRDISAVSLQWTPARKEVFLGQGVVGPGIPTPRRLLRMRWTGGCWCLRESGGVRRCRGDLKTALVVPPWCQNPGAQSESLVNNGWEMVEAAGIELSVPGLSTLPSATGLA
jgi:hypothetical protein